MPMSENLIMKLKLCSIEDRELVVVAPPSLSSPLAEMNFIYLKGNELSMLAAYWKREIMLEIRN